MAASQYVTSTAASFAALCQLLAAVISPFFFFFCKGSCRSPCPLPLYHPIPGEWSPLVLWLQKHAKYLPWHLSIVLPEGHPSTRKEGRERGIESCMKASQPSIYPHLTLWILMQSLFQICRLVNVLCSQGPIWNLLQFPILNKAEYKSLHFSNFQMTYF